jgi:outer membrane protein assembly factor BamB
VNVGSNGTPTSAAPSLADGVLYVASSAATGNNLFALDPTTG